MNPPRTTDPARDAEEALQIVGLKLAQAEAREKALAGLLGEIRGNTDNEVVRARIDSALAPRAETWVPRAGDVVRYIGPEDNERDEPANHRIVARVEERVGQEPYLHTLNFWTWSKNGSQASWYRYLRPATPSERLAAGLPAPEPAPERPSHVRLLNTDAWHEPHVREVVGWTDDGRPCVRGFDGDNKPSGWEPVKGWPVRDDDWAPAPSPARESSKEPPSASTAQVEHRVSAAGSPSVEAAGSSGGSAPPLHAFALALARHRLRHHPDGIDPLTEAARALLRAQEV